MAKLPMSENARDTQFAGFAALLAGEIDEQFGAVLHWAEKRGTVDQAEIARELSSRWVTLIARRAYDLANHTLASALDITDGWSCPTDMMCEDDFVQRIPDLTTWPEDVIGDAPGTRYYNRDEPVSTNYLHIEPSKDVNADALAEEIRKAMDRTANQIKESCYQRSLTPEASALEDESPEESDADKRLRTLIREEVRHALYPGGLPDPHRHRRVEMTEEDGTRWRGMLYAVEEDQVHIPASGICWSCSQPGENMEWYKRGGRSHLIHATPECRQRASEKPEVREHRG